MEKANRILQILRIIFLAIIIAGLSFRLLKWEGSSHLLVIGVCGLAFFYALQVMILPKRTFADFIWYYGIAIFLMGALFKLQNWPDGEMMLMVGLGGIVIGGLMRFTKAFKQDGEK